MANPPRLTSVHNPLVQTLRALTTPRGRREHGLWLLEGPHLLQECLRAQVRPDVVFFDPDALRDGALAGRLATLADEGARVFSVAPEVLARVTETKTPQAIVAAVALTALDADRIRAKRRGRGRPLLLILDDVRDPGNVGTLLRSALAADVDEVLVTPASADVFAPKVARAASGAHFFLPIRPDLAWDEIEQRVAGAPRAQQIVLADSAAPVDADYTTVDYTQRTALIVCHETRGPSPAARHLATRPVRITMYNGVDSLNVAVATSVILAEAVRQRRLGDA